MAVLLSLCGILVLFFWRCINSSKVFMAGVFLSPAMLLQAGYSTGNLDPMVLLLSAIGILFVHSWIGLVLVFGAGLLIHEMFLFLVPAHLVAFYLHQEGEDQRQRLTSTAALGALAVLGAVLITKLGRIDLSQEAFEDIMLERLPNAAFKHPLWSGYYELSSSVNNNVEGVVRWYSKYGASWALVSIPLTYLALLIYRATQISEDRLIKMAVIAACVAPIFISLVASDVYRWIGMGCNVAILLTLYAGSRRQLSHPRSLDVVILSFSLLGPLGGAAIDRPFPMLQLILERAF